MLEIFARQERIAEWNGLIAGLCAQHRAKRRLQDTLDTLTQDALNYH